MNEDALDGEPRWGFGGGRLPYFQIGIWVGQFGFGVEVGWWSFGFGLGRK